MKTVALATAILLVATPALAHVTVSPKQSKLGATETYTLTVPSEGMITASVVLDVPDDVTIVSVNAPGNIKHEEKKVGDRIVTITWTIEIKAGASSQLSFVAKNPAKGSAITWKVHQRYSDGMLSDWTGAPGTSAPAPVTTLVAGTRP